MCGIAAVLHHREPLRQVRAMLDHLRHRGDISDEPVILRNGTAALGTQRLRIVDPTGGTQPVLSHDGQWSVVFNGEIYNHASLRKKMLAKGIRFRTCSDTEVLANLIALEGPKATISLDGMFAFVAIHRDGLRWMAARDPVGIKPLYWAREGESIYFSSEILPILEITPNAHVHPFTPGKWLTESGELGTHWKMPRVPPFSRHTLDENAQILKQLLEGAVAKRLPPDLPCAVLFSGGIDSTLIFHIARKLRPEVRGFYVGKSHGRDHRYVKSYAEHFGVPIEFVPYSKRKVLELIPKVVGCLETFEPNQIRNGIFSYLVSQAVSLAGYRVALCGEGADELFCGYPELSSPRLDSPRKDQIKSILDRRRRYLHELHKTQLQRVDRCGMRHQLEVRVPFLDRKILDFSLRLPVEQLVDLDHPGPGSNKILLRHLYRLYPEIPEMFSTRDKVVFVDGSGMGDNAPAGPFFEHGLAMAHRNRLTLENAVLPALKNLEEAYYLDLLKKTHKSFGRLPFLHERPDVNAS